MARMGKRVIRYDGNKVENGRVYYVSYVWCAAVSLPCRAKAHGRLLSHIIASFGFFFFGSTRKRRFLGRSRHCWRALVAGFGKIQDTE